MASSLHLVFCPSLLRMLESAAPPSIDRHEFLPDDATLSRWVIYAPMLERDGVHRSKVYVGSGAKARKAFMCAGINTANEQQSPTLVKKAALGDGSEMGHKDLLCWIPTQVLQTHQSLVFFPCYIYRMAILSSQLALGKL